MWIVLGQMHGHKDIQICQLIKDTFSSSKEDICLKYYGAKISGAEVRNLLFNTYFYLNYNDIYVLLKTYKQKSVSQV